MIIVITMISQRSPEKNLAGFKGGFGHLRQGGRRRRGGKVEGNGEGKEENSILADGVFRVRRFRPPP